ncbi:MAG: hypothetical protein KTR26_21885 [Flammeovirgaceae bacterium]|nr:hypothetical protein [Flammeovirgaceae bacterium]
MNKFSIFFTLSILILIIACDKEDNSSLPEPAPEACIQLSDTIVPVGEVVEFLSCSQNSNSVLWILSGIDSFEMEQFTYSFDTPGVKDITLVAENNSGDQKYSFASITVTGEEGKIYGEPDLTNNYYPQDIVSTPNQGFLVTYRLWPSVGSNEQSQLRIVALDANVEFKNSFVLQVGGANPLYSDILNLSNGKIGITWSDYISGYSGGYFGSLESDLSSSEINTLNPSGMQLGFKGLIEKEKILYNFGFQGDNYDYELFIRKTELDGTFIETKTISKSDTSLVPYKMVPTEDNGFVIAGLINTNIGSQDITKEIAFILKVDANFNIIWEKYFGVKDQFEQIHYLLETSDGILFSYGYNDNLYFQNISPDGKKVVEHTIDVVLSNTEGDIIDFGSGYLIATGSTLLKTDYQFNIISKKFLNSRSKAIRIIKRIEGGFALLMDQAIRNAEHNISPSNIYIVKLDESGEVEYFQN